MGDGSGGYDWSNTSDPTYTSYMTTDYGYGSDYDDDGCYLPADTDSDAYDWEYGTDYSWDTSYGTDYSWDYSWDYSYGMGDGSGAWEYGYGS
jgi:hypothetical protein